MQTSCYLGPVNTDLTMFAMESIYLAAIIHGTVQTIILLTRRRGAKAANRMLALLVGLLTFSLWNLYSYKVELPAYWRLIDYEGWYSPLLWGPALYFYVLMISDKQPISIKTQMTHYSVGIMFFVIGTGTYLLLLNDWISQSIADTQKSVQLLLFYVQITLYLYASFQITRSHDTRIKNHYSSIDKVELAWLQRLVLVFAVLIAVDMVITVPHVLRNEYPIPYLDYYLLAEAVAIYAVGYFYLLRDDSPPETNRPKYQSSPLDEKNSHILLENLKQAMQETKPFLNPDLKLGDLAKLVDIHPHYLSQLINEQLGKNFYDFVNDYRAELAAELLSENARRTITEIAYESGFNNRVSFGKAFKKLTGMTPTGYRRKYCQPELPTRKTA